MNGAVATRRGRLRRLVTLAGPPQRRAGGQGGRPRRARGLGGHGVPLLRGRGPEHQPSGARAAQRAAPDHRHAGQGGAAGRGARPGEREPAPGGPRAGPQPGGPAPARARGRAAAARAGSGRWCATRGRSCATWARRPPTSPARRPTSRASSRCSTTSSTWPRSTRAGARARTSPGREEGFLFWIAWVSHQSANLFATADAHGPFRPSLVAGSCQTFRAIVTQPARAGVPDEPHPAVHQPGALRRMIKQAPTRGRILAMVAFALSCFAILLSLWLQFGGPIPLRPQGYRVQVAFPEGTGITKNIEVRAAGIPIGAVVDSEVDRSAGRALATIEIESEYAPLSSDARAILRRKTLLGETFVEIATGPASAPKLADGGRLDDARVAKTVELDEVLADLRPHHPPRVPDLAAGAGHRGRRPRREPEQRARAAARLHPQGREPARGARRAGERGARPGPRHRRGLLGAEPGRGPAARAGRELPRRVQPDRRAARLPRRGVPDLPRVPHRVEGHARAARGFLTRHAAAGARPAPGGAGAAAHRARRTRARARPQALLPELRPADRGLAPRPARRSAR